MLAELKHNEKRKREVGGRGAWVRARYLHPWQVGPSGKRISAVGLMQMISKGKCRSGAK